MDVSSEYLVGEEQRGKKGGKRGSKQEGEGGRKIVRMTAMSVNDDGDDT